MKKNIFVALDYNSLEKALDTTKKIKDQIAGVKMGTELYAICGTEGLKKFKDLGVTEIDNILIDTFLEKNEYFSHRRAKKLGENDYGRCISIIKKNI